VKASPEGSSLLQNEDTLARAASLLPCGQMTTDGRWKGEPLLQDRASIPTISSIGPAR
jgi:hypothetical protein